jgi:hypothetical protein
MNPMTTADEPQIEHKDRGKEQPIGQSPDEEGGWR